MKKIGIITLALLLVGCGLDNRTEPKSRLSGKIVCQGEPICLRQGKVVFELYQDGYELREPIMVYVAQDGSFSVLLFDGDYTMTVTDNNGPWMNGSASVSFSLRGNKYVEYEVEPYYLFADVNIVLMGNTVKAVCNVNQVAGSVQRQKLSLLIGERKFIDANNYTYLARKDVVGVPLGSNSISIDISNLLDAHATLYARLALQMNGVAECVYSNVIQIR